MYYKPIKTYNMHKQVYINCKPLQKMKEVFWRTNKLISDKVQKPCYDKKYGENDAHGGENMAVTIKDIAASAGVSYSMVSRALNGSGAVDQRKKEQILQIAQSMGYMPNQAAVTLKKSRSGMIGLCFSTISKSTSPFVLHDVLTGVFHELGSKYQVVVKGIDMHQPGTLNPSYFDGLLIMSQGDWDQDFLEEAREKGIPMVAISRKVPIDIPAVVTDEKGGMEKAMEYLIRNGHHRIGVIEGPSQLEATVLRHEGWQEAARKRGMNPEQFPVDYGNYRYNSGRLAAGRLLDAHKDLTALLCFNDEMAFGARSAAAARGLRVPEDISLTGFDNWDLSGYADMRLTTVERSAAKIAMEGSRMLLACMEEGERPSDVWLENRLVVRESVRNINFDKTADK